MKNLCRDLRERTVGLLGTIWLPREASTGYWNCTVYMEEAFRHNTIKRNVYYIFLTLSYPSP
jgi:hypothetical protein